MMYSQELDVMRAHSCWRERQKVSHNTPHMACGTGLTNQFKDELEELQQWDFITLVGTVRQWNGAIALC